MVCFPSLSAIFLRALAIHLATVSAIMALSKFAASKSQTTWASPEEVL